MYTIKKGNMTDQAPDTWFRDSAGHVFVKCPECKGIGMLDHEVADDGTVTPSLECTRKGCTFHKGVMLEGWVGD